MPPVYTSKFVESKIHTGTNLPPSLLLKKRPIRSCCGPQCFVSGPNHVEVRRNESSDGPLLPTTERALEEQLHRLHLREKATYGGSVQSHDRWVKKTLNTTSDVLQHGGGWKGGCSACCEHCMHARAANQLVKNVGVHTLGLAIASVWRDDRCPAAVARGALCPPLTEAANLQMTPNGSKTLLSETSLANFASGQRARETSKYTGGVYATLHLWKSSRAAGAGADPTETAVPCVRALLLMLRRSYLHPQAMTYICEDPTTCGEELGKHTRCQQVWWWVHDSQHV